MYRTVVSTLCIKKAVLFVEVIEKNSQSVGRDGLNDLRTQVGRGVLIGQIACRLLAFARDKQSIARVREAIDSTRAETSGRSH